MYKVFYGAKRGAGCRDYFLLQPPFEAFEAEGVFKDEGIAGKMKKRDTVETVQ